MQQSIARSFELGGVALHSGRETRVQVSPAPPDTGIVFRRTDLPGAPAIPARVEYVTPSQRCTTLSTGSSRVQTVEHLLSALWGMGIDNATIEIEGEEVPMADGSAARFVELIEAAGISVQDVPRQEVELTAPVEVQVGGARLVACPDEAFRLTYAFLSDHPAVSNQVVEFAFDGDSARYATEVAPARTIGFLKEIEAMRRNGLALGGNVDAAVVVGEDRILSDLRFPDEIARHKLLDMVGDLALLGRRLRAHVIGIRSGHALTASLGQQLVNSGRLQPVETDEHVVVE